MKYDISVDLETLGTNSDAVICSIGACLFDRKTGDIYDEFYQNINWEQAGRSIKASTVEWWLNQSPDAVSQLLAKGEDGKVNTIEDSLLDFSDWIQETTKLAEPRNINMWAKGSKFDIGILEHAYKQLDLSIPWSYNSDRCMRSLMELGVDVSHIESGTAHNALDDAVYQAKVICEIFKQKG